MNKKVKKVKVNKKKEDKPKIEFRTLNFSDSLAHKRITNIYGQLGFIWIFMLVAFNTTWFGAIGFFVSSVLILLFLLYNYYKYNKRGVVL